MILANYDSNEADGVRKILGKKKVDQVDAAGKEFISRAVENGLGAPQAEALWAQMAEFAKYSFNRAHAYGYAIIAYWCAWLKYYYPVEFLSGVLSTVDKTRIPEFIKEARRLKVSILAPDVNESRSGFRAVGNSVRYGIDSIKGIGPAAVSSIVENQPYTSWEDFQERSGANSGVLLLLAQIGAFDNLVSNRKALVNLLEAQRDGSSKRCVFKSETLNEHNLPCGFDWASEPDAINPRNGKVLKPKAPPKKCTLACRNYQAPEVGLDTSTGNYTTAEIQKIEMDMLGVYLMSTPFDSFEPEHRKVLLEEAEKAVTMTQGNFVLGGILSRVVKKQTRSGVDMGFCTIETEGENFDFAVFPKDWDRYRRKLKRGELFVVEIAKNPKGASMQSLMPINKEEKHATN
jgi:DNA polymerase-3 subunit alpha